MFSLNDIRLAHCRISNYISKTPLLHLSSLSQDIGANIYLKLENRQVGGSVKSRGAFNKILTNIGRIQSSGFVTASSGNHAISISIASSKFNVPVKIFVPETTTQYKISLIKKLGGSVEIFGHSWDDANAEAIRCANKIGATYVHAFEDPDIIHGHATSALEVSEQLPNVDIVVCSVGGGGILSAYSQYMKLFNPSIQCYGVETLGAHSVFQSLLNGRPTEIDEITSQAQSICVKSPTQRTYDLIKNHVSGMVIVTDHEAQIAQKNVFKSTKELLELASACSVSACTEGYIPNIEGKEVVILACGGNTTEQEMAMTLKDQTPEQRYYNLSLRSESVKPF